MPLGDANSVAPAADTLLSNAEKDQNAANLIDSLCKRVLNQIKRCVDVSNKAITDAPSAKAAILALTAGGATDIQALMDAVVAAHNTHKAAAAPTLTF